jgi:hypothetical protein
MDVSPPRLRFPFRTLLGAMIFPVALLAALLGPSGAAAQQLEAPPSEEIVANLAAGRVIVAVLKDGILIGTIENPIEVQTHPPIPVAVTSVRAEVLLGAVDWVSPSSQIQIARLDRELPRLRGTAGPSTPSLSSEHVNGEATDLESIGQAVYARFNEVLKDVHGKITLPTGEPLAQLIVADYARDYGPEVWQLSFDLKQDFQREDYFDSSVTHPAFIQFWPPEKGQPHALIEFQYPPENRSPAVMELLREQDPRIEKLKSSDNKMAEVARLLAAGQSGKILSADAIQFLRAVLDMLTPPKARQTLAILTVDRGLDWIVKPPAEPKAPPQTGEQERPPDAPSLRKPPSSP